jgi:hypothetical protein
MCRVGTCTRVAPAVQQRQPRAAVKEAEGYHRRASAVAGVASACASKRSSASGGLGLATLRRTSRGKACISAQPRPAMPHGANGSTKPKEAFCKHLQARQGPNAFALGMHVRPHWFLGPIYTRLSNRPLIFFRTKLGRNARKRQKNISEFFFPKPRNKINCCFFRLKGPIGFVVPVLKKF